MYSELAQFLKRESASEPTPDRLAATPAGRSRDAGLPADLIGALRLPEVSLRTSIQFR
jgi:hypothetical protein